ncbi:MAG: hypothetical protein ACLPWD_03350 [Methanobacterium sp.]
MKSRSMNRVTLSIPKDIDLNFRQKAALKFSFRRGWYGKAILEAIELWITHQTKKFDDIPDETKNYLWSKVRDKINPDTDEPQEIVESVVDYFQNLKYTENIRYEMNKNKIIIRKENPVESYIPYLITRENDSIFLNCPVKAITGAALKDLTGDEYNITSNENSLIYSFDESKFLDKELLLEKTSAIHSSQSL